MDRIFDCYSRSKRFSDPFLSSRKAVLILLFLSAFVLYVGPSIFNWLRRRAAITLDPETACISELISIHNEEINAFSASVRRNDIESMKDNFLPFIGNGHLGLEISPTSWLMLRNNSILSVPIKINLLVALKNAKMPSIEGTVIQFNKGIVNRYQCISKRFKSAWVRYRYMSHRTKPSLIIQEIQINNVLNEDLEFQVQHPKLDGWIITNTRDVISNDVKVRIISGTIPAMKFADHKKIIVVVIATTLLEDSIKVSSRSSKTEYSYTVVKQSEPTTVVLARQKTLQYEEEALKEYTNISKVESVDIISSHVNTWEKLWKSGFEISTSKASNVVNGDRINATIYYALSNSRAYLHESSTSKAEKDQLAVQLAYTDHCYGGHQTLQASSLWSPMNTLQGINHIVSLWFLTLDKQGCHQLIKAGADGVMQAMILSLGALSFSENHLEFRTQPKDLHRNYLLRRVSYGVGTHVNISVVVGVDNKAIISAALDQNDKEYYACDGGCLDPPVQLSKVYSKFPVKKTDPPTAVLYITADKDHMELLKHTIHVQEVIEAPAHEHHVIALHKHGHHWGGLPPLFWISIIMLVLIFHLFLFKLIYNEYCTPSGRHYSSRYTL